jgi:hypothetical protein|tara:strand:- start:266 stop:649 length:384 start_codon:yes stop_codon:yes gene_type:complete
MSHIFFEKNSNYLVAKSFDKDQFTVEVSYAPESTQLELVFDPSEDYFEELQEKLTTGEWEHFVLKVAAYYDGQEMASDYLGSNVSADPIDYIKDDTDGMIDEMVETVVKEARDLAYQKIAKMQEDFA